MNGLRVALPASSWANDSRTPGASRAAPGISSAKTPTPWTLSTVSPWLAQSARTERWAYPRLSFVELTELTQRRCYVAGERPAQDPGSRVRDEHAEQAAGRENAGHDGEPSGRVVEHLKDAVGQYQVERAPSECVELILQVALQPDDLLGYATFGCAASESGQCIDADVHNGDAGAGLREQDSERSAATAAVQDSGTLPVGAKRRQERDKQLADNAGAPE